MNLNKAIIIVLYLFLILFIYEFLISQTNAVLLDSVDYSCVDQNNDISLVPTSTIPLKYRLKRWMHWQMFEKSKISYNDFKSSWTYEYKFRSALKQEILDLKTHPVDYILKILENKHIRKERKKQEIAEFYINSYGIDNVTNTLSYAELKNLLFNRNK